MTNLFKDFHRLCDSESQIQAQDFTLKAENAALKESIRWKDIEISALKEQVAYLEELNRKLCDKANQLTIMDARAGETIAQQAEAIRLKDAALEKIACIGNGDSHGNSIGNCLAIDALAIQPSSEILQARDGRVAEAITKYLRAVGVLSYEGTALQGIISGEWRKYL